MDYKKLYNQVGKKIGWDFGRLKKKVSGVRWNFYEEVLKKCDKNTVLLDIGMGGGEKVLELADKVKLLVGIDHAEGMVKTARKNLTKSGRKNVYFYQMEARKVGFPDGFFDVIACRQSNFFPKEVYRLLKPGGWFLTQQVGEDDKENITKCFGRGISQNKEGTLMNRYGRAMKQVGFKNIKMKSYNATEWYAGADDIIYLLKHAPIVPNFGGKKEDMESLAKFIAENKEKKGIKTNSRRFMIVGRK